MSATITRTARDGRTITVHVQSASEVIARVDGNLVATASAPHAIGKRPAGLPAEYVVAVGPIVITQAEADQINEARRAFAVVDLPAIRRGLVEAAEGAAEDALEQTYRAFAEGVAPSAELAAKSTAADASVAAFDAEHPEVLAQIIATRAADVQRLIEAGN